MTQRPHPVRKTARTFVRRIMFLSRMPSSSLRRFSPSLLSDAVAFIALARLIGSEKCSVNRDCGGLVAESPFVSFFLPSRRRRRKVPQQKWNNPGRGRNADKTKWRENMGGSGRGRSETVHVKDDKK